MFPARGENPCLRRNHPNIATLYSVEDAKGVKAIVMEFCRGTDLG